MSNNWQLCSADAPRAACPLNCFCLLKANIWSVYNMPPHKAHRHTHWCCSGSQRFISTLSFLISLFAPSFLSRVHFLPSNNWHLFYIKLGMNNFNIPSSSWHFYNIILEMQHLFPDSVFWDSDDLELCLCLLWDKCSGQEVANRALAWLISHMLHPPTVKRV